jgi:hypothetical protein
MHIAARSGQQSMISALLEDGADPTAFSKVLTIMINVTLYIKKFTP